jgi:hypothetical protein
MALAGCGDDDDSMSPTGSSAQFEPDTTCAIAIEVAGEFQARIGARDPVACLASHSVGDGIDVSLLRIDGPLERVELHIDEITRGETGPAFPATVELAHADGRDWIAEACTASIETHVDRGAAELGRAYEVRGTVDCAMPAIDDAGSELTVQPFAFIVTITWGGDSA